MNKSDITEKVDIVENLDIIEENDLPDDENRSIEEAKDTEIKAKNVLIEFKNVTKEYARGDRVFYALKDANLTINEGEMVVILGPSGAGKSTLLNLLGGMDRASSGEIFFDGADISKYSKVSD